MSVDKLQQRIIELQNPTVVGLDPNPSLLPPQLLERAQGEPFARVAEAITAYNKGLIDALCDIVPAVKPQIACYEQFRHEGVKAFYDTVRYAQEKGMFVITDAKRGDIGSTCDYYAAAHLGAVELEGASLPVFNADALTVNPYLGSDGITPFMKTGKLLFVLVKTSNPSSGEFQDRLMGDLPLYRVVAAKVAELGADSIGRYGYSTVGAVGGATYPEQLAELRAACPSTFFLVPGYGAQGGTAADVAAAFDKNGLGAIVNSSRGIIGAWKKADDAAGFAQHAREAALRMREDLLSAIGHEIKGGTL